MIDTATSMLGQPYRFGGAAPGGFDCSGLVVYAAAGAGDLCAAHGARNSCGFGKPIGRGELQAGDLVFMHLAHKELHVGIAIDGELFVHAPSTRRPRADRFARGAALCERLPGRTAHHRAE